MRRQIFYIGSVLMIFAFSCTNNETDGTLIQGKVTNPAGDLVYMQLLTENGFEMLDSTNLDSEGNYKMGLSIGRDEFLRINFANRKILNLILDGTEEEVTINVDGSNPSGFSEVLGSYHTDLMRQMDSIAIKKQSDIQLLNQEAIQARSTNNQQLMIDIREQYFYLVGKYDNLMKEKVEAAAPSLAGIYGLNYLELESDIEFASRVAEIYKNEMPDHFFAQDVVTEVENFKKLAVGAEAPEINLLTPEGENLALSSLRGNYVLIDFWAAWCRPCRMENPNVVRLYNKYKEQNFEIYGVSLDRKREDWLRAIEKDGLTWKHVSDLKYFNSEAAVDYNISAIPATYLIGPDGKIVAKGLRGESLRMKLEELFEAS